MIDVIRKIFESYNEEGWNSSDSNDLFADSISGNISAITVPHFFDLRFVKQSEEMWDWVSSLKYEYYVETFYDEETAEADGYEDTFYPFDDFIRNMGRQYGSNPIDSRTGDLTQEADQNEIFEGLFGNSYKQYLTNWIKNNIRRDQDDPDIGWILSNRWKDDENEEECAYPENIWDIVKILEIEWNGGFGDEYIDLEALFENNGMQKISSTENRGFTYNLYVVPGDPRKCIIHTFGHIYSCTTRSIEQKLTQWIQFPVIYPFDE